MRNPHGYATIVDPGKGVEEFDTISCIHCGGISMTRSRLTNNLEVMVFRADGTHYMKEAGFCRSCMKPICPRCVGKGCNNRFRRLEAEEALARKLICS